ncbi:MAG TPA: transcription elongation factor GreAB [Verrucomicrobiota bacterium]|nr:transcription elongation factor GreAB [Verrucomicrobiota bacterium]HNT14108.1 transcription elongation factor GreAB [Verrucomicrobiota bacterium]
MNKRAVLQKIIARLRDELGVYFRAAQNSRAEATHEQSRADNKYDTRGLEASYLARGQSRQAAELEAAIAEFQQLATRPLAADHGIGIGALVALQMDDETALYFIGPRAGGTTITHAQHEILVITPQSPLGAQLLGKMPGNRLKLDIAGRQQRAQILSVW